jgi:chemotaxis protein methyltransferase CheR
MGAAHFANRILADVTETDIPIAEMETIRRLLAERTGFSLYSYKDKCIKRRIAIRIRATHSGSASGYCSLLEQDEKEVLKLFKVLTIHVTHFFRNPDVFKKLQEELIPVLFDAAGAEEELKFWSVGCATGEEPYTLALILKEYFGSRMSRNPIRIIATDINGEVLDAARQGLYGPDRLVEMPQELLDRNFIPENGEFRLNPDIRDMVNFSQSDLFSEEPFPVSNLILCRNVQIYFERSWQERLLKGFFNALAGGGYLVLGKSETLVGDARRMFQPVCPVERIYKAVKPETRG